MNCLLSISSGVLAMLVRCFECTVEGARLVILVAHVVSIQYYKSGANGDDFDRAKVFLAGGHSHHMTSADAERLEGELEDVATRTNSFYSA